jgi:hypothetical protein
MGMGLKTPPRKKLIITRSENATPRQTYLRWKGKRLKDLKIGSWKILSLYQSRALKILLDHINKYELVYKE